VLTFVEGFAIINELAVKTVQIQINFCRSWEKN